jgi:acyl-CoA synthetase (AMP-forming)/AMP-acid ligase II
MLIPMADVPRWYAERKPRDTIAISHGNDTLTWEQLERNANRRARALAAKGVKPGDFVAIGLPNGNTFFETSFAVWKLGATPTSLSWRCRAAKPRRCWKSSNLPSWSAARPTGTRPIACPPISCLRVFRTNR